MPPVPKPRPVLTRTQESEFEKLIEDPKFRECITRLTGWRARRAAGGQNHPYLGREDLRQVALIAAYETFGKFHGKKPYEDIRRLSINAMRWALQKEYRRACLSGGGSDVMIESLDEGYATQATGGAVMGGAGNDEGGGWTSDLDASPLMREVTDLCGEPDPLTLLLIKERAGMVSK